LSGRTLEFLLGIVESSFFNNCVALRSEPIDGSWSHYL
jgi:hypothetical protein